MATDFPFSHWSSFRAQLYWVYERTLNPTPQVSQFPYYAFPMAAWCILSGKIRLRVGKQVEEFGPGGWIFPPEGTGVQELSSQLHLISVRFDAGWSYGSPLFRRERTVWLPQEEAGGLTALAQELKEAIHSAFPGNNQELFQKASFSHYLGLQPKFMQWLLLWEGAMQRAGLPRQTPGELDERMHRALHRISSQPLAEPLHEEELARSVGWSRSHLNRQCLRYTGATPAALWNQRRLEAARARLLHSGESVKEIAFAFGFSAPEHFTRWFGRQTGLSPRRFRQNSHEWEGLV